MDNNDLALSSLNWEKEDALITARILLEIEAINFSFDKPYTLTSGWKSPVYIDCRKIIFFPRARKKIIDLAAKKIEYYIGYETIQAIVGGETAGIPFAAWLADRLMLPMAYVRKKPKGFGRNAQIEGDSLEGLKTILVEDLTTDGASKIHFINALRHAGADVNAAFVVFFYGVFPGSLGSLKEMDIRLLSLCTWWDVLKVSSERKYFSDDDHKMVRNFLEDPCKWSKQHGGVGSLEEALEFKNKK